MLQKNLKNKLQMFFIGLLTCLSFMSCGNDENLTKEQIHAAEVAEISESQMNRIERVVKTMPVSSHMEIKNKLVDRTISWNHSYIWWYSGCALFFFIAFGAGGVDVDNERRVNRNSATSVWLGWLGGPIGIHRALMGQGIYFGISITVFALSFFGLIKPLYIFWPVLTDADALVEIFYTNWGFYLFAVCILCWVIDLFFVVKFALNKRERQIIVQDVYDEQKELLRNFVSSLRKFDNNYDNYVGKNIPPREISRLRRIFNLPANEDIIYYRDESSDTDFIMTNRGVHYRFEDDFDFVEWELIDKVQLDGKDFDFCDERGDTYLSLRAYDMMKDTSMRTQFKVCLNTFISRYVPPYEIDLTQIKNFVAKKRVDEYEYKIDRYIEKYNQDPYAILDIAEVIFDIAVEIKSKRQERFEKAENLLKKIVDEFLVGGYCYGKCNMLLAMIEDYFDDNILALEYVQRALTCKNETIRNDAQQLEKELSK